MANAEAGPSSRPLNLDEYKRYGRQMIQPEWGLPGQLKLKQASIAVVGAGGLGCPVLQYLVGAGVGTITVIDHDTVDVSNLHRQILHTTDRVGLNKANSAVAALKALNPHSKLHAVSEAITPSNAQSLLSTSDLIVDCTDRPLTRYLLSDASLLLDVPLVSGAAIASSGQWATYGGKTKGGKKRACYRCMWPAVIGDGGGMCSDVGVWGPVTGMVGTAMAAEVLREIMGNADEQPMIHMLQLGGTPLVRSIKLRPPSEKCIVCGPNKTITALENYDYQGFCLGTQLGESLNQNVDRISPQALKDLLSKTQGVTIIDTRPPVEFGICSIPSSHNVPLNTILSHPENLDSLQSRDIIFVCRQGNDSLVAAERVQNAWKAEGKDVTMKDLKGGLIAWSREVDPEFPVY